MKSNTQWNLEGKKALVVGMGLSGNAALRLLQRKGAICDVYDSSKEPDIEESLKPQIRTIFSGGTGIDFKRADYDLVVLSPGVPTKTGIVKDAKDAGLFVLGEMELAYRFAKGTFIGITGTNGKTTTTTWTYDVFRRANLNAHLAGNVGIPLSDVVLEHDGEDDIYICEISSYQLESMIDFQPMIACILNITPDHLQRHGTMEAYAQAKFDIAKKMDAAGTLILNLDDEILRAHFDKGEKAPYKCVGFSKKDTNAAFHAVELPYEIGLRGEHNLENALAVIAISETYGIEEEALITSLKEFPGVAHRNEYLQTKGGVSFYNDSKATNPEASIPALKSITEPVVLIAGGMDKKNDYSVWIDHFDKVKYVCLFGETKYDIAEAMRAKGLQNFGIFQDLEEAFQKACSVAVAGDVVLLSPACASWDMYKSFEIRGDHFRALVERYSKQGEK